LQIGLFKCKRISPFNGINHDSIVNKFIQMMNFR
jgi:hypothetical protein